MIFRGLASGFVSRVAGLGALTAAGQLLIIVSLPAYSRFFDPTSYGDYVIFVGAYTVVSVLAGMRYDSAIVLPRNDRIASALSGVVMCLAVLVSAGIVAAEFLSAVFELTPGRWAAIVPLFGYGLAVATVVGALQRVLTAWCVRSGKFLSIGWSQFAFSLATVIVQLTFVQFFAKMPSLIWGYVCALTLQALCLVPCLASVEIVAASRGSALRAMRIAARRYRRFPIYMVGYALASSVRDRLVPVVLGIGAGAAVVGRFGLAYRVVFAPNSLVYSAISPVFFSIASRGNRAEVGRFAAGLVEAVFVALVVPYTAFAIEAPALTDAVLSEKWFGTGPYIRALAGPALMLAATCWLDRAFDSFGRQRAAFALEFGYTLAALALIGCLSRFMDPVHTTWAFAAMAIVYYWTYFMTTFVACGFPLEAFRRACRTGILSLGAALPLGLLTHAMARPVWRLPLYAALMACLVGLWMRFLNGSGTLRVLLESKPGRR